MSFPAESPEVLSLISAALSEDKVGADVTTNLCIDPAQEAEADILAKQNLVVCGLPIVPLIFERAGKAARFEAFKQEGELVEAPAALGRIRGKAKDLLSLERTILNFLQRLCGVASLAREYSIAAPGLKVLDTRKTTPGWRMLEKYAVRAGGGVNHRATLADLILVKNNHVDLNGGDLAQVLAKIERSRPEGVDLEVEVRNASELGAALGFSPRRIMLDNMSDDDISRSVKEIRSAKGRAVEIEASGGITKERLPRLSALGVDCVSVGALTTQAVNKDISLRIKPA